MGRKGIRKEKRRKRVGRDGQRLGGWGDRGSGMEGQTDGLTKDGVGERASRRAGASEREGAKVRESGGGEKRKVTSVNVLSSTIRLGCSGVTATCKIRVGMFKKL